MTRLIPLSIIAVILMSLTATHAGADFLIGLSNVNLGPGDTGTMDISITSNSNDTLSAFGLELLITPQSGATSLLQFTSSQPNPYGNSNYVFSGESFNADQVPIIPFWGAPTNPPNFDTITGGDSDDSTQGYVTIPAIAGGAHTFLGTVQFQAPQGATPGDQFQISLVGDPNFTYFDDQMGNSVAVASVIGGLVTISSAVPEPSSMTTALIGLGGLLGYGCSRRIRKSWISSAIRTKIC